MDYWVKMLMGVPFFVCGAVIFYYDYKDWRAQKEIDRILAETPPWRRHLDE